MPENKAALMKTVREKEKHALKINSGDAESTLASTLSY